jgi:dTDP-4-dehydrorhamnose reductase/2-polyprenyl-3-methyl-5-hydroxy-6-metoxy-1,4-benzoquinol methylase
MRLCIPPGVEPTWVRRTPDPITLGYDLTDVDVLDNLLLARNPDVIVNLAGESNVDKVQMDNCHYGVNVILPMILAGWCSAHERRLVHVSSQAIYASRLNRYGGQKWAAEGYACQHTIVRLTFVLGIRPLPHVGRENPLEAMMRGQSPQVNDRWFSPLFAWDAAEQIWDAVLTGQPGELRECGIPERWSRFDIAKLVNPDVQACSHDDFAGLALRPIDTTYTGSRFRNPLNKQTMQECCQLVSLDRHIELALFFGVTLEEASAKLAQGFGPLHEAVTKDWNTAINRWTGERRAPMDEDEVLHFYRTTEAYIWELSAYHEDPGFNYAGMCEGIAQCLISNGCKRVLCLGDGIGDLTLALHRAGLRPRYHDLAVSRTLQYARFRFWRQTGQEMEIDAQNGFMPDFLDGYDAIIALDFLEHLPNLEEWMTEIHAALVPHGLLMARNAFGKGSGRDGSMPMHLAANDRFEDVAEWEKLCRSAGFEKYDPSTPDWWIRI